MGCRGSRTGTEENGFVVGCEGRLWGSQASPQAVEAAVYKAMAGGVITEARFKKVLSALDFRGSSDLLESFRASEEAYDGVKLLLFSLLHSAGPEREKAAALWDVLDPSFSEEMSKSEAEAFIQHLVSACLDPVPLIITPTADFSRDRVQTWLSNLKQKKGKFAKDLAAVCLGSAEKLTKTGFLNTISQNAMANVTNPAAIRARMEEMKMMPAKFASAFSGSFTTNLSTNNPS